VWMAGAFGKFETVLLVIVALFRLKAVVAVAEPLMLMAVPCEVLVLVELVIVVPVIVALVTVPSPLSTSMPLKKALVNVLPVTDSVPEMLLAVSGLVLNAIFESRPVVPELLIVPEAKPK